VVGSCKKDGDNCVCADYVEQEDTGTPKKCPENKKYVICGAVDQPT
jgi:hypothetical protein